MEHAAYIEMAEAEAAHWWFQGRRRVLEAVIIRLNLSQAARILEIGSGTGGNFEMLSRFGQVTAVEANDTARRLSARKFAGAVNLLPGLLPDSVPAFERKFELICLLDVLEHIEQDEKTLRVIRRLLAPGGSLLLTVPAFAGLWGPHDERMHHKRRYARNELQAKLQRAGFAIVKLSYSNMFLFPAALAARLGDRYGRRRKASGTGILPGPINRSLAAIFGCERLLMHWMNLPVGLSLLAVARPLRATLDQM